MDEELFVRIDPINGIILSIDEDGVFAMYIKEYPMFAKHEATEGLKGSWNLSNNGN